MFCSGNDLIDSCGKEQEETDGLKMQGAVRETKGVTEKTKGMGDKAQRKDCRRGGWNRKTLPWGKDWSIMGC